MRSILLLSSLLLVLLCPAQEVLSQERWPDGRLRSTRYSEGGRIHFITYHENGKVHEVGCFRNGRRDGVWKQFSDTGVLLAQAGFSNGERQGVWEFRSATDKVSGRLLHTGGMLARGEQLDEQGSLLAQRDY